LTSRTPSESPPTPSLRIRVGFAAFIGAVSVAFVYFYARVNTDFVSDFDQVWAGAAALWRGENPYLVVGPGEAFHWRWPLYYPLPALVLTAPLGLLPVVAARMVFAGISAALLAYAVARDGFTRWPLFISVPFLANVELVQWSNILAAAILMPPLGWIVIAKPNIGVAVAAAARTSRAVVVMFVGALVLTGISFALLPDWPSYWLERVRSAPHFRAPVTRPGGFLLLVALLRWRRPEARLVAALALTPLTPTMYDPVLLYVVTRTFREALALTLGTAVLVVVLMVKSPLPTYEAWGDLVAQTSVWAIYLPCVVMVLRRPNEGPLPALVERLVGRRREP
jgi:hypothetical protein